jgi:hypothetical protein
VSLKALAAEAQEIILAMPEAQRREAGEVLRQVVIIVERSGAAIPPALVKVILAGVVEVIAKWKFGRSLPALALQVMQGAPLLLEPHRAEVEDLVSSLTKGG